MVTFKKLLVGSMIIATSFDAMGENLEQVTTSELRSNIVATANILPKEVGCYTEALNIKLPKGSKSKTQKIKLKVICDLKPVDLLIFIADNFDKTEITDGVNRGLYYLNSERSAIGSLTYIEDDGRKISKEDMLSSKSRNSGILFNDVIGLIEVEFQSYVKTLEGFNHVTDTIPVTVGVKIIQR